MAYLELDRRGRARTIAFDAQCTDLFRHLVTSRAAELDLELPDGSPSWADSGAGSFGTAEVRFSWAERVLRRERLSYHGLATRRLTFRADIEVNPRGLIKSLSAEEAAELQEANGQTRSGQVSTELRWLESGRFTPPGPAHKLAQSSPRRAIGVVQAGASAERKLLEDRVAGLTGEQLLGDLLTFCPGRQHG
jgi:hypothetical protein